MSTRSSENRYKISTTQNGYLDLSLIQLIANPEKYTGRKIQTIGFFALDTDSQGAIYVHYDDYKYAITKNALRVDLVASINRSLYDQKYVIIQGIFNGFDHEPLSLYNGSITKIDRFDVWTGRSKLRKK